MTRTRQFLVPVLATLGVLITTLANPGIPLPVIGTMLCLLGIIWAAAVQSWGAR